jgi:hypothetical protein
MSSPLLEQTIKATRPLEVWLLIEQLETVVKLTEGGNER